MVLLDLNGEGSLGLWEDVAGKKGLILHIRKKIALTVETSAEALEEWKATPALDAWITFEAWHDSLKDTADLVKIPKDETVYRGTAAVATNFYKNREAAREFSGIPEDTGMPSRF